MRLDPEKLSVEFLEDTTPIEPIIGRKYTLTHSDDTGELFLSVGIQFDYDKVNEMRDEVLGEWRIYNGISFLYLYVCIDGEVENANPEIRNEIFRREMPLAIEAIRHGDNLFFSDNVILDQSQIWIQFYSKDPVYNKFEYWGVPMDYKWNVKMEESVIS